MIVDLVQTTTRDGLRLDGALQVPGAGTIAQLPIDGCIFIHGTGGSFYSSTLFDGFATRWVELGCSVLRVNTRGHDLMSTALTTQGGRRVGAAFEVVDESRHDLAAWVDCLERRGIARIGIVGHSLGAVKAVYTLARDRLSLVKCVVAVSPPRLSYSHFCADDRAAEFLETYRLAAAHVQAGRAATLMEVRVPLPFIVTAGGYVEKYGPAEQYNILKFAAEVRCPTLFTFGSVELQTNMAFRGLPELLGPIAAAHGRMNLEIVPGADHFYTAQRDDLVTRTERWIRSVGSGPIDCGAGVPPA